MLVSYKHDANSCSRDNRADVISGRRYHVGNDERARLTHHCVGEAGGIVIRGYMFQARPPLSDM
jgi:hypothetical protein